MLEPFAVVCVPARQEEKRLPRLIAALADQTDVDGRPFPAHGFHVVILLNGCTDQSHRAAMAAARVAPHLSVEIVDIELPPEAAHVGSARRHALDLGLDHLERLGRLDGALLTTDADAVPAPDWVAANLAALMSGADLVGGAICGLADEEARLPDGVMEIARRFARYWNLIDRLEAKIDPVPHDPLPRHRDHTGASLAVTAAAYVAAGRLPTLPSREDVAFVAAVRRGGGRVRHCPRVRVEVSARMSGRAAGGMADTLKRWAEVAEGRGAPLTVDAPDQWERRFRDRARLRQAWENSAASTLDLSRLAATQDIGSITQLLKAARNAVAFVETLAPLDLDAAPQVPLDEALRALEERVSDGPRRQLWPVAA